MTIQRRRRSILFLGQPASIEIPYEGIDSVRLKPAGMILPGYLQIVVSESALQSGLFRAYRDRHSIVFSRADNPYFAAAHKAILSHVSGELGESARAPGLV